MTESFNPKRNTDSLPTFVQSEPEPKSSILYALVDPRDSYVEPLIRSALAKRLPAHSYRLIRDVDEIRLGRGESGNTDTANKDNFDERNVGGDGNCSLGLRKLALPSEERGRETKAEKESVEKENQTKKTDVLNQNVNARIDDQIKLLQFRAYEDIDFELAHCGYMRWTSSTEDMGSPRSDKSYGSTGESVQSVKSLVNAYMIRKGLIRKHFLAKCVEIEGVKRGHCHWASKEGHLDGDSNGCLNENKSLLRSHFPTTVDFELDYAQFLDEALLEAYELKESFERNDCVAGEVELWHDGLGEGREENLGKELGRGKNEVGGREWWILKPSMGDGGQGVRLFSSEEELRGIFEEWEEQEEEEEGEDHVDAEAFKHNISSKESGDDTVSSANTILPSSKNNIITSQLRHFVAQKYITQPLLFPNLAHLSNHKFHVRTYVVAVGSLKVYVYRPMLALFAPKAYKALERASGSEKSDVGNGLRAHLTNTCLSDGNERKDRVKLFWDLPDELPSVIYANMEKDRDTNDPDAISKCRVDWKEESFTQICAITSSIFETAAREMMVYFQTMPNAFEIFGVDFLLDRTGHAWLLEVNAFPDFKQTGEDLKGVIAGLFEGVVDVAVKPFFSVGDEDADVNAHTEGFGNNVHKVDQNRPMKKVLDIDLGRR